MRIGCFTPLLSQFPLDKVFEKLRSLNISTVELGTGNYPGDPHCKLSMLDDKVALKEFKQKFADNGFPSARSVRTAIRCIPTKTSPRPTPRPAGGPCDWPRSWKCRW